MLSRVDDVRLEARCDRCLATSPIVTAREELVALEWELRLDGQTWCPTCSRAARTPAFRPTARGVARRRRG